MIKKGSKQAKALKEKTARPALSRRQAFKQMFGEALVCFDEMRGRKHCSLSELEQLECEKFEKLIPVIDQDFKLSLDGNWLVGKEHDSSEELRFLELTLDKTTAFNLINGRNTIQEITRIFSEKMKWELEQSFKYIKNMILNLVNLRLCNFANPTDD